MWGDGICLVLHKLRPEHLSRAWYYLKWHFRIKSSIVSIALSFSLQGRVSSSQSEMCGDGACFGIGWIVLLLYAHIPTIGFNQLHTSTHHCLYPSTDSVHTCMYVPLCQQLLRFQPPTSAQSPWEGSSLWMACCPLTGLPTNIDKGGKGDWKHSMILL